MNLGKNIFYSGLVNTLTTEQFEEMPGLSKKECEIAKVFGGVSTKAKRPLTMPRGRFSLKM